MNNKIRIFFRYDDYSYLSNTKIETSFLDVFQQFRINCLVGVTPKWENRCSDLGEVKSALLRKYIMAGTVTAALHGLDHVEFLKNSGEFSGRPFLDQLERIDEGKRLLEYSLNEKIHHFIPPWNQFDSNTLKALEKLNFSSISSSLAGAREPVNVSKLIHLPATTALHYLEDSISFAKKTNINNPVIVVLFHSYQILDSQERENVKGLYLNKLKRILEQCKYDSNIEFGNWQELNLEKSRFSINRFNFNFQNITNNQSIILKLGNKVPHIYWSEEKKFEFVKFVIWGNLYAFRKLLK